MHSFHRDFQYNTIQGYKYQVRAHTFAVTIAAPACVATMQPAVAACACIATCFALVALGIAIGGGVLLGKAAQRDPEKDFTVVNGECTVAEVHWDQRQESSNNDQGHTSYTCCAHSAIQSGPRPERAQRS